MVRSADESPDVLLLQRTEIETLDNPPEEHPECSLDTVLKNMLSYGSSAFYERAWWGLCLGVGRGQAMNRSTPGLTGEKLNFLCFLCVTHQVITFAIHVYITSVIKK